MARTPAYDAVKRIHTREGFVGTWNDAIIKAVQEDQAWEAHSGPVLTAQQKANQETQAWIDRERVN